MKHMKKLFFLCFPCLVILLTSCARQEHRLFSYFTGNGEDGLHLAGSENGYHWTVINDGDPLLASEVGSAKLMRDPDITEGPEGLFHMVWTCGWNEKGIGYASSGDLVNWSEQQYLPVMEHEPDARNCWAPEITYDPEYEQFLICWSTTIPGRFPMTDSSSEDGYNHRIYYVTTNDFQDFSETRLLYDKSFNVIDASIYPWEEGWFMLLKDETLFPPEKNIRIAFADRATGPYSGPSNPITGDYWAEGPTAIHLHGQWIVYFDKYREGAFGAVQSADLHQWQDISDQILFPEGVRHGTAFSVDKNVFRRLQALTNKE